MTDAITHGLDATTVSALAKALGIDGLSSDEAVLIAAGGAALFAVLLMAAQKRATKAGKDAATRISTADEAERAARRRE